MSNLPPPPPHAAPYAPPPPPHGFGGQPYQYPLQNGYQQPPPPPANYQNGSFHDSSSPPRHGQHTGHERQPKSKMIITRYPRPPPQHQSYPGHQPSTPYNQPPPPPAAMPYPQGHWNHPPPQHGPPPPTVHPPPPNYAPLPANHYPAPPPPQPHPSYSSHSQPSYSGYPPPPNQPYPPPPPPQAAAPVSHYPPPPPHSQTSVWNPPAPTQPPQAAYSPSPAPTIYQPPPPSITPAQSVVSVPPTQQTPGSEAAIKDRNDPTFYDGWDEGDFEYGGALWIPPKGDTSHDIWSIGQYIWHPAAQVTQPIPLNVDDPVPLASLEQKYDPAHFVIASRYFETENGEGHEYVYNFQRIRYVDAWKERKDDPLFKVFTIVELHKDVLPADEVLQQVLARPKDKDHVDIVVELESNVAGYLNGTKGGTGKNIEKENALAALGVTGAAKPVFATPFPAYNPPPDEVAQTVPRRAATYPRREAESSITIPQRSGFNPFKVSGNLSRQATPRSLSYSRQPSPLASAAPQPMSRSQGHSYQGSASSLSPTRRVTPPQPAKLPPPPPTGYTQPYPAPPPPQHPPPSGYGQHSKPYGTHLTPSREYGRSPTVSPWNDDPWKVSNGYREGTPAGPATPVGSDFGDITANGQCSGSAQHTPIDSQDHRKRKMDEPESHHRKRTKAKGNTDSAYQRRW